jgi:hypothetical protein
MGDSEPLGVTVHIERLSVVFCDIRDIQRNLAVGGKAGIARKLRNSSGYSHTL